MDSLGFTGDEGRGTGDLDGGNGLPHPLRGFAMTVWGGLAL